MIPKEKKWYIFDKNHHPLTLDDKAIEFDTKEKAAAFAILFDYNDAASIEECIFYYYGGYVDCDSIIHRILKDMEKW